MYVHATTTASGITTIRTCNNEQNLLEEYNKHTDFHTQSFFTFISLDRWFAIRLETLVIIFRVIAVYACIFARGNLSSIEILFLIYLNARPEIFKICCL
jgi:hypothetical protein